MLHHLKAYAALKVLTIFYLSKRVSGKVFDFSERALRVGTASNVPKINPTGNEQKVKLDIIFYFHTSSWNTLFFNSASVLLNFSMN